MHLYIKRDKEMKKLKHVHAFSSGKVRLNLMSVLECEMNQKLKALKLQIVKTTMQVGQSAKILKSKLHPQNILKCAASSKLILESSCRTMHQLNCESPSL